MMRTALLATTLLLAGFFAGCSGTTPTGPTTGLVAEACNLPATIPAAPANPRVVFNTTVGDITAEIYQEQAPVTAKNFLDLVQSGFYDTTKFHRVISDFMMQGGDPNTKPGGNAALAGQGGPGYAIQDEFHHKLRLDHKGVLAMANSGPNTGGSQFFITFVATTWLNDKHAVFGQVVGGSDVLDRVNKDIASKDGAPKTPLVLNKVTVLAPAVVQAKPIALSLWSPDADHAVQTEGGKTQFLTVVQNDGDRNVPVCVEFPNLPAGLTAATETGYGNFHVPAGGQRVAFIIQAEAAANAPTNGTVHVKVRTVGAETTLDLHVARSSQVTAKLASKGTTVSGNYIGMTTDGRLFDTSVKSVALYANANKLGYGDFQVRPSYQPFSFSPGGGVIQGFTDLAVLTHEGGKSAGRIAPEQAYGTSGQGALAGRTLLFQLEVLSVK